MVLLAYKPGSFCQPYSFLHSKLTVGETKRIEERTRLVATAKLPFFIAEFCKLKHFLFKLPYLRFF